MSGEDFSGFSILDLFRLEAESQALVLSSGLIALERDPGAPGQVEACMRAAHSLKGAARIVHLEAGVRVAHAMEDCLVAVQEGRLRLHSTAIDLLLAGTDLLTRIAHTAEADMGSWEAGRRPEIDRLVDRVAELFTAERLTETTVEPREDRAPRDGTPAGPDTSNASDGWHDTRASDRVLRVTAGNLNAVVNLAGQALVESRWAKPFSDSLLRLKRMHQQIGRALETVRAASLDLGPEDPAMLALAAAQRGIAECEVHLTERLHEIDHFDGRNTLLAHRLYGQALACHMRPFADGVEGLPRMVRDVARSLGKEVILQVEGGETQVDRDILGKLEAPLGHLLRNAVDHGVEAPAERQAAGKRREATIGLEARHSAGALHVIVSDDGRGIDMDQLRRAVVARNLTTEASAAALSENELLQFLFLPGFSMKGTVTHVSGRGVGLDAVQDMLQRVRGTIRVTSEPGKGTRFQMKLPVTLSVVRTLLADVAGEPYAFPLSSMVRTLRLPKEKMSFLEGRQHFEFEGRQAGLVTARQVLGVQAAPMPDGDLPVIVMGDGDHIYGLVVDRFLGERELVVQPLDPQLGKIKDIAAGALMEDGSPVLMVDAEDLIRSMDKLVSGGGLLNLEQRSANDGAKRRKRVLVVDDSLTVRQLERKLLGNYGYEVEVAVDGMDGWNAVRTGQFDLVVTDIDMPRMDGIELVTLINRDVNLKDTLPVMIVSYKDRPEDRQRGLEAGAAYYLTKGSFHDDTLLAAVIDLIGEPAA
jgi:two-component system sensor histidine kinase and response regulator WspE